MRCRGLALLAIFFLVLLTACGRSDRSPTADSEGGFNKLQEGLGVIKGHLEFEALRSPDSAPTFESPRLEEVEVYAESTDTVDTYPGKVDNNGDYIITRLPRGRYNVIAETRNEIYGGIIKEVDVTSEETKEIQDVLFLSTQGRISGRVVLIGPRGERLPETGFVEVFIPGTSFFCRTTRKGEFTFYYIPAGEYTVAASCQGYEDTVVEGVEVALGSETQIGEIVMHLRGPSPESGSVFGVVTASLDHLIGRELKTKRFPGASPPPSDPTSTEKIIMPIPLEPIPGARVSAYPIYPINVNEPGGKGLIRAATISTDPKDGKDINGGSGDRWAVFEAITDENGKYRIEDIPAGDYSITVSAKGFERQDRCIIIEPPNMELRADFSLLPEQEPASIYGVVLDGSVDCGGMADCIVPIPEAKIELRLPIGQVFTAWSGKEGDYRIDGIPVTQLLIGGPSITVTASKIGYEPQSINLAYFSPGEEKQQDFHLKAITPGTGTLIGVVRENPYWWYSEGDELVGIPYYGKPIPGAKITAMEIDPDGNVAKVYTATTGRDGEYRIPNMKPDDYTVRAEAEGFETEKKAAAVKEDDLATVDFYLLPISDKGVVFGTVMVAGYRKDSTAGDLIPCGDNERCIIPIEGAVVNLYPVFEAYEDEDAEISKSFTPTTRSSSYPVFEGYGDDEIAVDPILWPWSAVTDEEGKYRIEEVPFGLYVAIAEAKGFLPQQQEVTVSSTNPEVKVDFTLQPAKLTYSNSGCLSNRGDSAKAADEIIAKVEGNDVYVTHRNAWYNCCLEDIRVELEQDGNQLKLIETAILEGSGCRCMCFYDVSAVISDLAAGEYIIQVLNEDQGLLGEVTVTVSYH
ncbi:MAG: carboxypeptidase-like regulatory domain-containing protein [bacterium]|nr:carboxypeptidase-like regulatory domain-containing protein [bacterium]